MAPIIAFMKGGGEPTMTSGTFPNGDKITFLIEVDEAGSSATYSAELKHGDKSISVQKATIRLGK